MAPLESESKTEELPVEAVGESAGEAIGESAGEAVGEAVGEKGVKSIERVLDIVESLSTRQEGMTLTELAKSIGLPKSTTHRLLSTLVRRGYAARREDGGYQIGLKLIEAVSYYINSLELQTEARQHLARLTVELGLTAHLGVLEGDQVVYIERIDVLSGVKLYSQIGLRMHAYCSSLGKCLLAGLSGEELSQVMGRCAFERFTPNTIVTLAALREEIRRVRRQGYAVDNMEYSQNNRCVGAPIYDYRGETVAAISASGPPAILTEERVPEVAAEVMSKARAISRNLGHGG